MPAPNKKPKVGDIVHYMIDDELHMAAMVWGIVSKQEGIIHLIVFVDNTRTRFNQDIVQFRYFVQHNEIPTSGTWHVFDKEE